LKNCLLNRPSTSRPDFQPENVCQVS